jgi:UDP:flavonoid glycosyltransferase YjiC (YdhE family)
VLSTAAAATTAHADRLKTHDTFRVSQQSTRCVASPTVRVLGACSLGGAGHFNPLVPFLDAARRRGDQTLVVGPPALADMVGIRGFAFQAGAEPSEAEIRPIREQLPVVSHDEAMVLGNRELFGRLAAGAMLAPMEATLRTWAPQLVLRETCEYASAIASPAADSLTVQVAISLAEAEAASIASAAPALEDHRKGLVDEIWVSPYITTFPASLDPSPFPTTIRCHPGSAEGARPLPAWWDHNEAPLVYVTFGTVLGHMSIAADVYRAAVEALGGLDIRVLLTVGQAFDPSQLGPQPPNVQVERWVEQAEVLTEADLVVCHGGSGTTLGALAASVPLVMIPSFADQFENTRRVAQQGAGLAVEPFPPTQSGRPSGAFAAPDPLRIRQAVQEVPSTPSFRRQAGRIADEMAATPTADDILTYLLSTRQAI